MSRFSNSSNPIIGETALQKMHPDYVSTHSEIMTVEGAVNKSLLLGGLLVTAALVGYLIPSTIFMIGGLLVGLGLVIYSVFRPQHSPITAPLYAIAEGLAVGVVTYMYASAFNGIVFQAISLTLGILFFMLFIYKSGIIQVTPNFRMGIILATGAVFLVYLASFVLSFFNIQVPFLHEGGMLGIGISIVILGIASLNLLLDFDNFDKGAQMQLPSYYEWFFGMGLMVTIVWIYFEVLRLLSKLNRD